MSHYKNFSFLLIVAIALTGCLKDSILPKKFEPIQVSTGLPLVDSKMTISNAVQQDDSSYHLSINSDGYYSFIFTPHKQNFPTAENFIVLRDIQIIRKPNQIPYIVIPGDKQAPYPKSNNLSLPFVATFTGLGNDQLKGAELKSITYKGGDFSVTMFTDYPSGVNLELNFISLVKNGASLTIPFYLNGNEDIFKQVTHDVPLDGYTLDLSGGDPTKTNQIKFDMNIISFDNPNGSSAYPNTYVSITGFSFTGQKWSKIVGKLGSVVVPVTTDATITNFASNSIKFLPFTNHDNGPADSAQIDFVFKNPSMYGKLYNSFGFPATLEMRPIKAIGYDEQILRTISGTDFDLPKSASSDFRMDVENNPDMEKLFDKGPKELQYSMYMTIDGTKTQYDDFILDTSKVATDITVELPLYGTFSLFNLKSIAENPLYQNSDTIPLFDPDSADVRFAYKNAMPVGFTLQVNFLDANNNVVAQLFKPTQEVNALGAPVGSDGFINDTISTYTSPLKVSLTKDLFAKIKSAPKLQYIAKINSTDITKSKPVVKIRPKDFIIIRLSAGIDGTVNLNSLIK